MKSRFAWPHNTLSLKCPLQTSGWMSATRPLVGGKATPGVAIQLTWQLDSAQHRIAILPDDCLPRKQGVGWVQHNYLQAFQEFPLAIVVKNVDVAPSKRQRVGCSPNAKMLKPKGKSHRVSTRDPLGPRRCSVSCKSSLFSSTCKSRSWRRAVETCGALLKPEAPDSYKIIYIFRLWSSIHPGDQPIGDVRKYCLLPARSNCEVFPSRTDQAVVITVAVSVSKSSSLISSNVSRSSP